ncbi:serine hydrolase domain-containing protein [Marinigracilibium pacificum]|uniref:Beta-lactamase family protein n=1 Tax=Marinigracilibium pacificum TaxID=2729599 RepID=A0A848J8Z3_9BACT|nr:serine hydrolase [Marinigracilibium pacificum]NMM50849.1 beta-lactamase family protein [Marinigracilibium pacificum]
MSVKTLILLICFYLLFISCQQKTVDSIKSSNPEITNNFKNIADSIYSENDLYGDVLFAVVNKKGLVYSYAVNRDIIAGRPSALNNNSPIYIASHTKSFTGTLVKILEENNKLNLDSSLAYYLPELTFNNQVDTKTIKLKDLLNHTHGTFSTQLTWKTAFLGYSGKNEELINDLNNDFLLDKSRVFRYSNVGPILAGIIIDKTQQNTWKDILKEEIFSPLKMSNTSAYVSEFDFKTIRPSVTATSDSGIIEKGFYKSDITMHASGGIISTIDDLSKWLSANIRQDELLLKKNAWNELHQSTTVQNREYFTYKRTGYSLGWDIATYQDERILTRFGGLAGISFHISFMPDHKIGVIAISTDNRASLLPHLLANYVYNQYTGKDTDSILQAEYKIFKQNFEKQNNQNYPEDSRILTVTDDNKELLGSYQNNLGWPDINISIVNDQYKFQWGVQKGKVYKSDKNNYLASLGIMMREFEIRNDILITGSLIYLRKTKVTN